MIVSGHKRPRSDCVDAQADLRLWCLHMLEDTFSHDKVHLSFLCFVFKCSP